MSGAQLRSFRDAVARRRAAMMGPLPLPHAGAGPCLLAARTLKGDSVVNCQNEELGTIHEIVLDAEHGRVAYAVLAIGGTPGLCPRLIAVPRDALSFDPVRRCFILDADKQALEDGLGLDKGH